MEYFQVSKVFKISEGCVPFPTPVSTCATSFFSSRISLQAVSHRPVRQLTVIYVVLFQLLFHFLHGLFVRERLPIRHINRHCNQIIVRIKILDQYLQNLCLIKCSQVSAGTAYQPNFFSLNYIFIYSLPPLQIFITNIHLAIHSVRQW